VKRPSEGQFGAALRDVDLNAIVYKPPDDARNWKPCDFMVWLQWGEGVDPSWFEVKDVTSVNSFAFSELRPAQLAGIRDAERIGIPYWLAVYWRRHGAWTISDAARVVKEKEGGAKSVSRELLMSRFGVDAEPSNLTSVLKSILLGEI